MNRVMMVLPVLALVFLGYVAGALCARFNLPPYNYLKNSFAAAEALFVQQTGKETPWYLGAKPAEPDDIAAPAVRDAEVGVGRYQPELAYAGYTVYTPVQSQFPIRLIDMQGETVHQWKLPLEQLAGGRDDGLDINPPTHLLTVASVRLLPDGSLIATLGIAGFTPWGYAVIRVDKDSNLIWKYTRQAHHDLDVANDGRVYALTHALVLNSWPGLEHIKTPFIDDQITILSAAGKEEKVLSVLEAIQGSEYQSLLLHVNPEQPKGDLLHVNSITWLDEAAASALPNAKEGDLLISLRQINVLAVLDTEENTIKWAWRSGQWRMQHDPDVLPNGNLLVFDNRGDDRHGGRSRIVEVNPRTQELIWEFPGDTGEPLFSSIYGSQERLPNGNTLISESNNGRILEVTRAGEIAWEYRIPERKINQKGLEVATVVFAARFTAEQLSFLTQPEVAE